MGQEKNGRFGPEKAGNNCWMKGKKAAGQSACAVERKRGNGVTVDTWKDIKMGVG